ncbi:MAG TPA: NAD(P)H-quinone oxidoreductase [Propionibacteriaceae bacterium]|nr:NAD(P)H-quinone oxidoreductase [Propionibacteriaceae bacterium]
MKAIVPREPGPPEVLELRDVEIPSPRRHEVLIKVAAAGVNRADLLQRQGHYQLPPGVSEIPGLEASGTIAEVGEEVSNWEVDDPCVALLTGGGYAEYVAAPAGQVVPPPLGVELVAAAAVIEVAATVYSNFELIGLADGDMFLVHGGAGGIGSFAIQYAKTIGATVITTAGSEDKLNYCRSIGADHAISYRGDWPAAVREVAADGVQMILDNMGAKYLEDHIQLLGTDGALVVIGMQGGRRGTLDLASLSERRGLVTANLLRARPLEEKAAICRGLVQNVWPLIADDTIKQPPLTVFPLAEAAAAHARLESGDNIGKIILSVAR